MSPTLRVELTADTLTFGTDGTLRGSSDSQLTPAGAAAYRNSGSSAGTFTQSGDRLTLPYDTGYAYPDEASGVVRGAQVEIPAPEWSAPTLVRRQPSPAHTLRHRRIP